MKRIKATISIVIAVLALVVFAGEAPLEMFPLQVLAGLVLVAVLVLNGRSYVA